MNKRPARSARRRLPQWLGYAARLVFLGSAPFSAVAADTAAACPVLVVSVGRGDEAERVGVRAGDCIVGYREREADAFSPLADPIALRILEWETAPEGALTLQIRRAGETRTQRMPTGAWGLRTLPALPAEITEAWTAWAADPRLPSPHLGTDAFRASLLLFIATVSIGAEPSAGAQLLRRRGGEADDRREAVLRYEQCLLDSAALDLPVAMESCRIAVETFQKARLPTAVLQARRAQADVLRIYGRLDDASQIYERAIAELPAVAESSALMATLHIGLGLVRRYQDRHDEALEILRQGEAILDRIGTGDRLRLRFANARGLVFRGAGRFKEALGQMQQASALAEKIAPESLELSRYLNNIALIHWDLGEFQKSLETFERVFALVDAHGGSAIERSMVLGNMASVALPIGRHAEAQAYVNRALDLLADQDAPKVRGENYLLLGRILAQQGKVDAAEAAYGKAQEAYDRVSQAVSTRWPSYFRARLLLDQGRLEEAMRDARSMLEAARTSGASSRELGFALQINGDVLLASGRSTEARDAFEEAVAIRRANAPGTLRLAESLHALGKMHLAAGELAAARTLLCEAVDVLELQRATWGQSRDDLIDLGVQAAEIHADCAISELESGEPTKAFDTLEKGRARALLELLYRQREELHALAQSSDNAGADSLPDRLLRQPRPWSAIRPELPADVLIVGFVTQGARAWVVAANAASKAPEFLVVDSAAHQVVQSVASFGQAVRTPTGDPQNLRRAGAELYRRLLQAAMARHPSSKRILFLSDGPFATLPVGALVTDGGNYLVEEVELQFSHSLNLAMSDGTKPRTVSGALELLAVADPVISDVQRRQMHLPDLPRLPGAAREAHRAAAAVGRRTLVLEGDGATEAAVRTHLLDARRVHIAVHGILDSERPLDSQLLLTPGAGGETDDGVLRVKDFIGLRRIAPELINVAACDLGAGQLVQGEGLMGLRHVLRATGTRRVISSLWAVSDRSSEALMAELYAGMADGLSTSAALRKAIATLRAAPRTRPGDTRGVGGVRASASPEQELHPFYWAGFVLDGELKEESRPRD